MDLALESRSYNTIFRVAVSQEYSREKIPGKIKSFFDSVKKAADEVSDRNLLACYYFVYDVPSYERTLEDLPFTDRNFEVFSRSRGHYQQTVEYLLEKQDIDEAASLCRIMKEYGHAGRICERAGDLRTAARDYREAKRYDDALRCCQKVGDVQGIARLYEKMRKYPEALKLWTEVGKSKEVKRIKEKMKKDGDRAKQPRLL